MKRERERFTPRFVPMRNSSNVTGRFAIVCDLLLRAETVRIVDEPFETIVHRVYDGQASSKRKNCCEILGKIRKNGEMYLLV